MTALSQAKHELTLKRFRQIDTNSIILSQIPCTVYANLSLVMEFLGNVFANFIFE